MRLSRGVLGPVPRYDVWCKGEGYVIIGMYGDYVWRRDDSYMWCDDETRDGF